MNRNTFFCFFIWLLVIVSFDLSAQDKKKSLESLSREEIMQMTTDQLLALPLEDLLLLANKLGVSIDELLKMQTSVASRTNLTPRESPGIVSVVTEEEIRSSGARDLMDVLKLVPGFDMEYDVDGVVGPGFRGTWVEEGKALVLVDGQMMNDLAYYNMPLGNHFDVSQIKKIEIMRGPGSAVYGGNAELCVINIITKSGQDIKGITAGATYGQLPETYGRINGSLQAGNKTGKWDWALKAFVGTANRSNGNYAENPDSASKSFVQHFSKDGSKIQTQNINLSAERENLSFHFIYDNYNTQYIFDTIPYFNKFRNVSASAKYDIHISDKISISPQLSYQYSKPYNEPTLSTIYTVQRLKAGAGLNYDVSPKVNIIAGAEFYRDNGKITDNNLGSHYLNLNNGALYGQLLWKVAGYNVVVGGRGENNSTYGSSFAPRLGITKIIKDFHFKILASGAFRSPAIGNIDVGNNLKVEKTFVLETELGYKINNNMFITGNIYDISINNLILYYDDGNEAAVPIVDWGYKNASRQGSDGFELEYKYKYAWGFSSISYSYNTSRWKSVPDYYAASGHKGTTLGFPQHKFTYLAGFKLNENITISPSFTYSGTRYGYVLDKDGNSNLKQYAPSFLLNLNFSVDNLLTRGLNFDLGIYNILNDKPPLIQPYMGGAPVYPGREREIVARLVYQFKFGE